MKNYFKRKVTDKLEVLVKDIKKHYVENLESIVVFGSLATGEFASYSDIDLLLILSDSDCSMRKRIKEFYKKLPMEFEEHFVSPIIITEKESKVFHPFYLGVAESYLILYDRRGLAKDLLRKIEDKITKGEILRKEWYWKIIDETIKVS